MGTQTMGSQGVVGVSTTPKPSTLCRQGSLYNLTLDEVQGSLGKPLSSMNMDELLKNVWSVEANQSLEIGGGENVGNEASGSNLNRQSSFSLSRDLSKKTVNEVWKEIMKGKRSIGSSGSQNPERQNTLGEMTLEDFLAHAGVSLDAPDDGNGNDNSGNSGWVGVGVGVEPNNASQSMQWMQYQQPSMMPMFVTDHHVPQTVSVGGGGGTISDSGFSEARLGVSASPLMGTLTDVQTASRKRGAPGIVVEKTVERRQKRMIKNRESAARSRARKQAYTNELENKISQLEAENERLRKMREVEVVLPSVPPPQPKYQLRRTSSAPL